MLKAILFFTVALLVAACESSYPNFVQNGSKLQSPSFWIQKLSNKGNATLLNESQIKELNQNILNNQNSGIVNLLNFDNQITSKSIRQKILRTVGDFNVKSTPIVFDDNGLLSDAKFKDLLINTNCFDENLNKINLQSTKITYAVSINRANLRVLPSNFGLYEKLNDVNSSEKMIHK